VYSATSDRRLKENIQPMNSVLTDVMKLQADNYTYKSDPEHKPCFGFIAQEVEPLFPQLVTLPTNDGKGETPYMMNYSGFGILAIKAIQEQQAIIDAQKAVNDAQEERIAKLEAIVALLMEKK
jgi:Chaperone of endosialidase